jgi:hypothetical protein
MMDVTVEMLTTPTSGYIAITSLMKPVQFTKLVDGITESTVVLCHSVATVSQVKLVTFHRSITLMASMNSDTSTVKRT